MSLTRLPALAAVWTCAVAFAADDYVAHAPLREAGLVKHWQLQLPLQPGQRVTDAYLVDDQIYVGTLDGLVFCIHADTGVLRWGQKFTSAGFRLWKPCHADDRVIIVTPPSARQYDRVYGDPIRETVFRFPAGSPAVSNGTHFFLGGVDRRYYCFELDWDYEIWKNSTDGQITAAPVIFGPNAIAFASDDGGVYAGTIENKTYLWLKFAGAAITADLVSDENGIYVASRDQSLYLLDPVSGAARWRARFSGPLYESPVLTKDLAFQYCPDDGVCAVETPVQIKGERIRWKLREGRRLLTVSGGKAYVLTTRDDVAVADLATGKVDMKIPAAGFSLAIPRPNDGAVLIASGDGRLFCARGKDAPPLSQSDIQKVLAGRRSKATSQPVAAVGEPPAPAPKPGIQTTVPGGPLGGKSKVSRGEAPTTGDKPAETPSTGEAPKDEPAKPENGDAPEKETGGE